MSVVRVYEGLAVDLSQLHDELRAAGLAPERVEGGPVRVVVQEPDGQGGTVDVERMVERVTLTLPDGTDTGAVDAVVAAHAPRVRYDPAALLARRAPALAANRRRALLVRAAAAATVAELRDILVAHLREEEATA